MRDTNTSNGTPDELGQARPDAHRAVARAAAVVVALTLGIAGLVLRYRVLRSPLGRLNADEATGGLMSYEIIEGHPGLMLAGANYGGAVESYPTALLLKVLGPSALLLKVVAITLWALVAVQVGRIVNCARGLSAGLMAGGLDWCFSGTTIGLSTLAYPGYPSGQLAFVTYLLRLGRAHGGAQGGAHSRSRPGGPVNSSRLWWVLTGCCGGVAAWMHPMYLALAVPPTLWIAIPELRRRKWRTIAEWSVGLILGISPVLANIARRGTDALDEGTIPFPSTYRSRLWGMVNEMAPRALGLRRPDGRWIFGVRPGQFVFVAIVGAALYGGARVLRTPTDAGLHPTVVTAGALPILAGFSHFAYVDDGRYFEGFLAPLVVCLIVCFGGLLGAVAPSATPRRSPDGTAGGTVGGAAGGAAGGTAVRAAIGAAIPLGFATLTCLPWMHAMVPRSGSDPNTGTKMAADYLADRRIGAIDGDYWAVYTLVYASGHRVRGAVPVSIRFPRDQRFVATVAGERRTWVYLAGSDPGFKEPFSPATHTRVALEEYVLYVPSDQARVSG